MEQLPRGFGPFTLEALLNRSAMAEVYLARRPGHEPMVLKRLLPRLKQDVAFRQLFAHECYLGTRVAGSGLPTVFEEGVVDGWPYMLLLPCPGQPLVRLLAAALSHRRRIGVASALHLALPICRGLLALHTATDDYGRPLGAIHMDVAPHNVLVSPEGGAVLIDLGIARSQRLEGCSAQLRGRSAYLAPEQLDGPRRLDSRVDIFAFGTMLHEMLCCRPLFRAAQEDHTLYRLRHAPAPNLPPDLAHRDLLEPILERCLARPRRERYAHVQQLADDLEDLAEAIQIDARIAEIKGEINALHVIASAMQSELAAPFRARNERPGIHAC